ncbi:HDOD domain-containing protein [Halioxenophilus sp. WMMB6]|uniref:HDOD domain-containing protein n=1 Tax=Halioxenophilus sp. WMMB6 TaxID=3073815 RepID=UPI00295E26BF|nr:HDOD domain-containing protein [Halioxenophilus sp. WMMB6]
MSGTKYWVDRLSRAEVPVMAVIVKQLLELTHDSETSVAQLAEVILKDANLTSQIIKVANSVHYNPNGLKISTVSRAIVLLGFDQIRSICVSLIVVDSLLKGRVRHRLLDCLAKSFHSANQAKQLCTSDKESEQEEAFIAGLLFRLGELVFWASNSPEVDQLDESIGNGEVVKEACQRILGTSFIQISRGLCAAWKLGPTLSDALLHKETPSSRAINLAALVAESAPNGWHCKEMAEIIEEVARLKGSSAKSALAECKSAAEQAISMADTFGAGRIAHLIPGPHQVSSDKPKEEAQKVQLVPDPALQLSILRELSSALPEMDLNSVFQMVLEGLHRGVGIERVLICLISQNKIYARYLVGDKSDGWRDHIHYALDDEDNLLHLAYRSSSPVWITNPSDRRFAQFYTPSIRKIIGKHATFLANVKIHGRPVAVFYVDRAGGAVELNQEQFEGFKHFIQQTEMCLQILSQAR